LLELQSSTGAGIPETLERILAIVGPRAASIARRLVDNSVVAPGENPPMPLDEAIAVAAGSYRELPVPPIPSGRTSPAAATPNDTERAIQEFDDQAQGQLL